MYSWVQVQVLVDPSVIGIPQNLDVLRRITLLQMTFPCHIRTTEIINLKIALSAKSEVK